MPDIYITGLILISYTLETCKHCQLVKKTILHSVGELSTESVGLTSLKNYLFYKMKLKSKEWTYVEVFYTTIYSPAGGQWCPNRANVHPHTLSVGAYIFAHMLLFGIACLQAPCPPRHLGTKNIRNAICDVHNS